MLKVRCHTELTIDAKGRLTLPAKIRAAIEKMEPQPDCLVLKADVGCLTAWLPDHWESKVEQPLSAVDVFAQQSRDFGHKHLAMIEDVEIDPQGRINVPKFLREHAGLTKDCVLFVVYGRIEIWDRQRWQIRLQEALKADDAPGMPDPWGTP